MFCFYNNYYSIALEIILWIFQNKLLNYKHLILIKIKKRYLFCLYISISKNKDL